LLLLAFACENNAELYHHESASRGDEDTPEKKARYEKERAYMKNRWPQFLMADPAYIAFQKIGVQTLVWNAKINLGLRPKSLSDKL
jgi:hypothetical protein